LLSDSRGGEKRGRQPGDVEDRGEEGVLHDGMVCEGLMP
jgi:hypothetical protein